MLTRQAKPTPFGCPLRRKMGDVRNIRKGILALELVIVLPVLLLVLLATVQFGKNSRQNNVLNNTVGRPRRIFR